MRAKATASLLARTALVVAAMAGAGCASLTHGAARTADVPYQVSQRERVWNAALRELQVRGFPIAVADPASGLIRTARVEGPGTVPCGFVHCPHRDTFEVRLGPDGRATVRLEREILVVDWEQPSRWNRETIAGIEAEQDAVAAAMTR